ncbi:MAG TPA: hypothetical protein VKD70_06585 [Candidatus Acidoferrum sp.]|nr:hypothetical protein [Candidatus Acidoferrum sp.]
MRFLTRTASIALALFICGAAIAATNSEAAFKKMQSLRGEWIGTGDQGMQVKSTFRLIVSDTTIMETLAMSGMEEMVTFYHIDGNAITLIHYCPTNNQPRMRAIPASADPKELIFEFEGAANLATPSTGHQHKLILNFDDANHITETWVWRQNGKDTPMVAHLARQKP